METSIAENIRAYRKQHGLIREEPAEAMDVSVGAVYKWKFGNSGRKYAAIRTEWH